MKLSYLIKNMGRSIIMGLCLFTFAFGMEGVDQVDYHNVKRIVEGHLANNHGLLDSSKGKDIVVFLGNTGAGKSTVINYLSEKGLQADGFDIILRDPTDPSAMVIGEGANSETFLPRFIPVGDLLFYDLPGFKDTRGTARNLVNACFIKTIIENARSTKVVFVAGMGQINDDRGESLKRLFNNVKQLFPNKPIENFGSLVITKSHVSKVDLSDLLKRKLDLEDEDLSIMKAWINHQRIDQISMPKDGEINYDNRESILRLIGEMGHAQIEDINIGVIYDADQQREIKAIYDAEIEDILEKLISQIFQAEAYPAAAAFSVADALSALDKGSLVSKRNEMMNDFNQRVSLSLDESLLIKLLRPISKNLYQSSWNAKSEILTLRVNNVITLINEEIAKKEKQEADQKTAIAQQQVEEARAAQAAAERRANDPSSVPDKVAKEAGRILNQLKFW